MTTPTTAKLRARAFGLAGALAAYDLAPLERGELAAAVPVILDQLRDAEDAFVKALGEAREKGDRISELTARLAGTADRLASVRAQLASAEADLDNAIRASEQLVCEGNRQAERITDLDCRIGAARDCIDEIAALVLPPPAAGGTWSHGEVIAGVARVIAEREQHRRDFAAAVELEHVLQGRN